MGGILRCHILGCTHCSRCFSGRWLSRLVEESMAGTQEYRTLGRKHCSGCSCGRWPGIQQLVLPGRLRNSQAQDQIQGLPRSTTSSPLASSPSWGWSLTWCTPPWARPCSSHEASGQAPAWSRACTASGARGCTAPPASHPESSAAPSDILGDRRGLRILRVRTARRAPSRTGSPG